MYLSWIYGQARTTFHHAERTISVPLVAGSSKISQEPRPLFSDLCKAITPPCRLNPLLFNGHLQTFWTAVKSTDIPIYYKRHVFESTHAPYPGSFAVDFVTPKPATPLPVDSTLPERTTYYSEEEFSQLGGDDTRPMLFMLHGLSGGSHEIYLRHVLRDLILSNPAAEQEWAACVVNSRGCSNSVATSSVLYNARSTWDFRQTVNWARERWPNRKFFGIGFSLGGNMLGNYLGEEGSACKLDAAIIVSSPWNLDVGSLELQRTFLGLHVYSRIMGSNMKALFEKHVDQLKKNPDLDVEKVRKSKFLHEFDRYVQCPIWKYPTEGAYYRDASSVEPLLSIRIPTLCIHAEDDPIATRQVLPFEEIRQNPYVVLCCTSLGGHLSWFELGGDRWFARAAVAYLNTMAQNVDYEAMTDKVDDQTNGFSPRADGKTPVFEGLRRKLWVPPAEF